MDITSAVLLILFCGGASFVQRVCGFGFGIFIMTMLPYFVPTYGEATTLSGMLSATQSLFLVCTLWQHITWKRLLPMLLTFLVVSFFAVRYVAQAAETHLKLLLGIILIVMSLYFLFVDGKFTIKPSMKWQISLGTLSGAMGGLFGMQGPPAVVYYLSSEKTKESYLAILQAYFLIGNLTMTGYRAHYGFFTSDVVRCYAIAFVGLFLGSWVGKWVFNKISPRTLRRCVYGYMIISGVIAICS